MTRLPRLPDLSGFSGATKARFNIAHGLRIDGQLVTTTTGLVGHGNEFFANEFVKFIGVNADFSFENRRRVFFWQSLVDTMFID